MIRRPPRSTLFPYTRSSDLTACALGASSWLRAASSWFHVQRVLRELEGCVRRGGRFLLVDRYGLLAPADGDGAAGRDARAGRTGDGSPRIREQTGDVRAPPGDVKGRQRQCRARSSEEIGRAHV